MAYKNTLQSSKGTTAVPIRASQLLGISEREAKELWETMCLAAAQVLLEQGFVQFPMVGNLTLWEVPPTVSFGSVARLKFKPSFGSILDAINENRYLDPRGKKSLERLQALLLPEHLEHIEKLREDYMKKYPDATTKEESRFSK
jgi:hypothetical protein